MAADASAVRASPGYRAIVEETGLDPVMLVVACVAPRDSLSEEPRWLVRQGGRVDVAGHGTVTFEGLGEWGEPVLSMPESLVAAGHWPEGVGGPAPGAPADAAEYHARLAAATEGLDVRGGVANGWLPIVEAIAPAVRRLLGGRCVLAMKEKYGTFQPTLVLPEGVSWDEALWQYKIDLEEWAEACSEGRCMVFGTPGRMLEINGWTHTLSAEALALGAKGLAGRIYPPKP